MAEALYHVVFYGQLRPGFKDEQACFHQSE